MTFSDLGLKPELVLAVAEKGYTVPTPIQAAAIPAVLQGRDVLAGAQTGTGKTAGFVLPILQRLGTRGTTRGPRCLILTPTRELAAQVAESAVNYGRHVDLKTQVLFGGVSERPQIAALRNGCDILVATPGRLLDLAQQKFANLGEVEILVLDEADRMLDMGFIRDIRRIIALLPRERQNLMFSATYAKEIRDLSQNILRNPVSVEVTPPNATADRVEQTAYRVPKDHKRYLLAHLIKSGDWKQVLVFTRTKHGANRLSEQLARAGIASLAIHGNKSQGARVRALEDFKSQRIVALIATEVAARGLDIKELPHVVNFELPNVPEDYVHRIGRTARAGASGAAVSLVSPDEAPLLKDIVRLLGRDVPFAPLPQFEVREPPAHVAVQMASPEQRPEHRPHQDPRRQAQNNGPRRSPGGGGQSRGGPSRGGQGGGRGGRGGQPSQARRQDPAAGRSNEAARQARPQAGSGGNQGGHGRRDGGHAPRDGGAAQAPAAGRFSRMD